jgi:hypothetical protein
MIDGLSEYNNNKGIHHIVDLISVLPRGSKTCRNAKPSTVTKFRFVHEEATLWAVLESCLQSHGRQDWMQTFSDTFDDEDQHGNQPRLQQPFPTDRFSLQGGVPNRRKAGLLGNAEEFLDLQKFAKKKTDAEIKLVFTEAPTVDEDEESDEERGGRGAKKRKVRGV